MLSPASALCPALFITAPASGEGKTTITAALARLLSRQGKRVRVFKTGPDYLDPQILQLASRQPVVQLDMWMAGEDWCQQQLFLAAQTADLIIIEGAMGMFDGQPSSADLAARFNIPMVIVMDVKAKAQTAAVLAMGLANYRDDVQVVGLMANHCASNRHRELIEQTLPNDLPLVACLANSEQIKLPERHLGLVQAQEINTELEGLLEAGADVLVATGIADFIAGLAPVTFFEQPLAPLPALLKNLRIAVAKDVAFSFIYQANIQLLIDMGAELRYFSPLSDSVIPAADALWLPGGYPELHAQTLADNHSLLQSVNDFHRQHKPILAECGGLLYVLQSLQTLAGESYNMAGLLAGQGVMKARGGCQGMQTAALPEGELRGHAHHRSASQGTPEAMSFGRRANHPAPGEAIYREGSLTASYLHLFFPSNPTAIARLFKPVG
ncbi:cobyrinate a,c-diamide synthase [Dasania sp. GY-MA-18]|uniref:Cobyrinate a,c-diamide synthase n=1 Tax=Dasania phycosphaerae TaxID=2950436 RepID=A0A9J6RKJ5_9GAMM|nr:MULTISPECIES: cobyrinate a,c-diamide synthase [Dasania]MCR8922494.1 cobyrinate a,c-diamide synthase [Dasania sp. GY-MA-18]MCZ0864922.1 cobyrinate a,c-diamide synthase [Dasania phycosphaerae]MCZ0868650.1 cobyrinate a,c-diamide synthase [Dasania phycosphaerae]